MHHVHTGVVLLVPQSGAAADVPPGPGDSIDDGWLVRSFACTTEVVFDDVANDVLDAYIASGNNARALFALHGGVTAVFAVALWG